MAQHRIRWGRAYWAAIIFLAALVVLIFFCNPGINRYERARFGDFMNGTAWRPFVHRTLFPSTVRLISWLTPHSVRSFVNENRLTVRAVSNARFQKRFDLNPDYVYEYLITYVLLVAVVVAFVAVLRRLLACSLSVPGYVLDVVGMLAVLGLPTFFRQVNYIYDFPTLLLFSLCLLLMLQRNWLAYCISFVLCAICKETAVLLVAILILTYRRDAGSRRLFDGLLVFQVLALVTVKAALAIVYKANPGNAIEFHLEHNLVLPGYSPADFVSWCTILFAVIYDWRNKPVLVRSTILMIIPLVALTFFLGLVDELRDYYEVYPGLIVAITYTVCKIMNIPCTPAAPTSRSSMMPTEPQVSAVVA